MRNSYPTQRPQKTHKTLIFCSGKVYYDLLEAREGLRNPKSTIIRVEQFYPFDKVEVSGSRCTIRQGKAYRLVPRRTLQHGSLELSYLPIFRRNARPTTPLLPEEPPLPARPLDPLTLHKIEQAALVADALDQPQPSSLLNFFSYAY